MTGRESPLVSVCLITYNHANFIKEAIESVLMQETDFNFEIIISDDCSTDGTRIIIDEYLVNYPEKIKINPISSNIGMVANWISAVKFCKGKYIALLEGDDYWIDNEKLQKQVRFMIENPVYSIVAHDVKVIRESELVEADSLEHYSNDHDFTLNDLVTKQIFLQTASIIFLRSGLSEFPSWVNYKVKSIDFVLYLMLLKNGKGHYLAKIMSVYRMHTAGISHTTWKNRENRFEWDMLYILTNFKKSCNAINHSVLNDKIEYFLLRLFKNNPISSKNYLKSLLLLIRLNPRKNLYLFKGYIISNWIPNYLYNFYVALKRKWKV
jgi:glycosyltransferase involved in cell wall biosynthesis